MQFHFQPEHSPLIPKSREPTKKENFVETYYQVVSEQNPIEITFSGPWIFTRDFCETLLTKSEVQTDVLGIPGITERREAPDWECPEKHYLVVVANIRVTRYYYGDNLWVDSCRWPLDNLSGKFRYFAVGTRCDPQPLLTEVACLDKHYTYLFDKHRGACPSHLLEHYTTLFDANYPQDSPIHSFPIEAPNYFEEPDDSFDESDVEAGEDNERD